MMEISFPAMPQKKSRTAVCELGEAELIDDNRVRQYVLLDEDGIRWIKPGHPEHSPELLDESLYRGLFSGCVRLYCAEEDGCAVRVGGTLQLYGQRDLIAAVPSDRLKHAEQLLQERANDRMLIGHMPVANLSGPTMLGGRSDPGKSR